MIDPFWFLKYTCGAISVMHDRWILSAKCEQVLSYYFGSTAGSARKTELLAASTLSK
jgi:hypothetical protein